MKLNRAEHLARLDRLYAKRQPLTPPKVLPREQRASRLKGADVYVLPAPVGSTWIVNAEGLVYYGLCLAEWVLFVHRRDVSSGI